MCFGRPDSPSHAALVPPRMGVMEIDVANDPKGGTETKHDWGDSGLVQSAKWHICLVKHMFAEKPIEEVDPFLNFHDLRMFLKQEHSLDDATLSSVVERLSTLFGLEVEGLHRRGRLHDILDHIEKGAHAFTGRGVFLMLDCNNNKFFVSLRDSSSGYFVLGRVGSGE